LKKNPDSSLNDITPPASRSAMISFALPIPLIAFHGSSFFSGALLSVGVGCGVRADGSGFGLIAVALSISSCACRLARRAAKNFSTCSAAAFLFAVSLVSVIVSGSADCFGFVGAVTVCVGFGSVFGTTGFGASISISGVTFAADSFSCISAICSAMRSGVKSAPRVSALVNFC